MEDAMTGAAVEVGGVVSEPSVEAGGLVDEEVSVVGVATEVRLVLLALLEEPPLFPELAGELDSALEDSPEALLPEHSPDETRPLPGLLFFPDFFFEASHAHSTDHVRQTEHLASLLQERQTAHKSWRSQSGIGCWHVRHLEEQAPVNTWLRKTRRQSRQIYKKHVNMQRVRYAKNPENRLQKHIRKSARNTGQDKGKPET